LVKPIGVLALQGDFREHIAAFDAIGVEAVRVRSIQEIDATSGLVIPGGESSVIHRLSVVYNLVEPIRERIAGGFPTFGTCAGLIMLAAEILDKTVDQDSFGGLDVSVRRNELDSFETDLEFAGVSGLVHAAFIRAPIVERVGEGVEVTSRLVDGRIVGVRQRNVLGISFHPEVTGETRIHEVFAEMVATSR
jgi:pyridoxal 5'-phosphate synthase pdxT subunit